MAEERLR